MRFVLGLALVCLLAPASRADDSPTIVRYKLTPGQEIRYKTSPQFKYGEGEEVGRKIRELAAAE